MEGVSDQDHGADRTEHVKAETQEDKKSELRCLAFPVREKLRSYPVCIRP